MNKRDDLTIREINGVLRGLKDLEAGRVKPFEQIEREIEEEFRKKQTASGCGS